MVENILCYGGPAEHWGPLPATRLASRKILIEQNIKKRTGPTLCVLCALHAPTVQLRSVHAVFFHWAWELVSLSKKRLEVFVQVLLVV
jgi:hypothetical protein